MERLREIAEYDGHVRPLTEHPEADFIQKVLNLIEEEDIAEFIATVKERVPFPYPTVCSFV